MKAKYKKNQPVWCYYHCTDKFKPPMCGTISRRCWFKKKHHFASLTGDGFCYWYLVRMQNGQYVKMPETCMDDLVESMRKDHMQYAEWCKSDDEACETLRQWYLEKLNYFF